jgi:hypothetical protein
MGISGVFANTWFIVAMLEMKPVAATSKFLVSWLKITALEILHFFFRPKYLATQ